MFGGRETEKERGEGKGEEERQTGELPLKSYTGREVKEEVISRSCLLTAIPISNNPRKSKQ